MSRMWWVRRSGGGGSDPRSKHWSPECAYVKISRGGVRPLTDAQVAPMKLHPCKLCAPEGRKRPKITSDC